MTAKLKSLHSLLTDCTKHIQQRNIVIIHLDFIFCASGNGIMSNSHSHFLFYFELLPTPEGNVWLFFHHLVPDLSLLAVQLVS